MFIRTIQTFLLLSCLHLIGFAQTYHGKTVGITDGDTFTFLTTDKKQIKVRLAQIDKLEKNQPYGQKARKALSDLIFNKEVKIIQIDIDRYGRMIGQVFINDLDVNREMVKLGMAWVYRKYVTDQSLFEVENQAKEAKRGIWSLPKAQQIPPWEWRRK